ncbi:DUF3857 domain-containing protein [Lutibacter sp. B1]|uniref:DUF3857 domain-containing protein n=1 Tax=Lutibacter sp. B1 TaxID=2725996 RepID=UPI0014579199|nr:DUF3857 domain-containing protein [Lutibacter sp. B1]NLP58847.1 DUF3857 domain-containing protein [Lutibacter sp. B1]
MKKLKIAPFLLFFITFSYSQDFNFKELSIPEALKKDANSVVRFENLSLEMKSQQEMIIKVDKAITVYNNLADGYADLTVYYDKRTDVKNIKGYVYDKNGEEIKKIRKSDFKDYSASGGSLYTDNRVLYYDYIPTVYPFTIHYYYEVKTSNTAFIIPWFPVDSYYQSVQKSTYSLKYPSDVTFAKAENNFEEYTIKKEEAEGILTYEIENVASIEREPYSPPFRNFSPNVRFGVNKYNLEGVNGEANDWKEFGKWYYENLLKNTFELSEATKIEMQNLTSTIDDPIQKAKIIYEYVQNKVRYISIQVGIGGYKPMLASEVDKLGYGDCKALTNYTKALLDAVGISSNYTVIYGDNDKRDITNRFLSIQGNHIILNVPTDKDDIWLECTSQKVPFGHLGSFTDDRDALVITPEGGIIKHTKVYKADENLQLTKGSFSIDNKGKISAKVNIESKGIQYDYNLQYDGKSETELDLEFKEYLSNINNIHFTTIKVLNNKEDFKFLATLEFTAEDYVSFSGDQMLVPVNAFSQGVYVPKRIRNRKLPIQISRGYIDLDEVEIKLPKSYSIEFLPETTEITSKFGTYSIHISKIKENTYLYKRKLKINEGTYPKEDYDVYRDFRKNIRKHDNLKIVLKKNSI